MSKLPSDKTDEIKIWIKSIEASNLREIDDEESCSSMAESSIIETSSSSESEEEVELGKQLHDRQINKYENILPTMAAITFNNVNISNSTNVYLGHVYNVNGNLNINVIHNEVKQQEDDNPFKKDVSEQKKSPVVRPACLIFPRHRWLAMDPLGNSKKLSEPVDIVVLSYTATTSSTVQAKNIGIIRDLQTLNVEAQGFNDIIYNFLIGCDGVVYEGRGWGLEGDHTIGYNHKSIGIGFVGNFKFNKPSERSLKACQNLFIRGVSEGHLSKDYQLLTSCQCSASANFDYLYEEFKNWDHFCEIRDRDES